MTLAIRLLIGFAMASSLAYLATPYAIALADRLRFYDKPVGYKGHAQPTPYLGGAAVMAGFSLAVLIAAGGDWPKTAPLLGGAALLWAVGTVDDRRTLSPALRVAVELALAALVWAAGLGWHLHLGAVVDLALTCVWVLGVVNAFNLFDNMDGAASTMALVVSAGAALLGVVRGDTWLAVGAASLGGACLGFLPRNICLPARIFLGDGGSMPMGFVAAVLVMVAASSSVSGWRSLPVALLLVGTPALDTALVIVSRRRRGVSLLQGGRDHLTHRVRRWLPSARAVALGLGAVQALVSVVAVLASEGGASFVAVAAVAYALAGALAIALLETQEVEEFASVEAAWARPLPERSTIPPAAPAAAPDRPLIALPLLGAIGLGAGISPFFFAYYDVSTWVPLGLGVTLVSAIALMARPPRLTRPSALALAGLLGIGVWSLCSAAWAESVESAVVSGNRWLLYGALLLLLVVLVRGERRAALLLGLVGLGVAAVALSVMTRLLGGDPGSLFLGGRLNAPLGYINGEGCLFVMGFWLSMALAEQRRPALAGPAAGMATLMACLALLSQSRGTALALAVSLAAVVALAPGRIRRLYGLLAVAGGLLLAAPELLHVYDQGRAGPLPVGVAHEAGGAALLAAVVAGLAWGLASAAWQWLAGERGAAARARAAASWTLAALAALALLVTAASASRIERTIAGQWRAFTHLQGGAVTGTSPSASYSRLLSGGGNRYDYWRIAWRAWRDHPLAGLGAGNYQRPYYEQRATAEDVEQPHSVELQVLSELGLVGAVLLACFLLGVGSAALRMRRAAAGSARSRGAMVGGLGAFSAWLAQSSVDWMHLLPGLSAIALIGAVVLLAGAREGAERRGRRASRRLAATRGDGPVRALAVAAMIATLVIAGASLSRQGLADVYRARAQGELRSDPAAAAREIDKSLAIDGDAVQSYYVKAAALARYDQGQAAEAALREALAREPGSFVTWTLLGDVAMREGRQSVARRDYARARLLNPRDRALGDRALAEQFR